MHRNRPAAWRAAEGVVKLMRKTSSVPARPEAAGGRSRAGSAWRILAALLVLGLVTSLLNDPLLQRRSAWQALASWASPARLSCEVGSAFAVVGRPGAGSQALPAEARLLARALPALGVREYTLVGHLAKQPYLRQRIIEYLYPALMLPGGAPYLVGRLEDLRGEKVRIIWSEKGLAIGRVAG